MDAYEATRIVFSRIQTLDPENASKIMGLLLIKDQGEKEMIRLAFGPELLLHSLIIKARTELGISSNTCSTPSTPSSSPSPFFNSSNPNSLSRQNSSSFSTTTASNTIPITTSNNTTSSTSISTSRMLSNLSLPNPSSWGSSSYSDFRNSDDFLTSPNSSSSLSYNGFNSNMNLGSSADLIDDFQIQEQLSFLNEKNKNDFFYPSLEQVSSPSSNSDGVLFPNYAANWGNTANNPAAVSNGSSHRRSCSVTDICMGSDPLGSGFGWKPCLYYNRGYCKNGTTCRFLHGDSPDSPSMVGSPSKIDFMEQCQELLRSKAAQQQQQQMRLNTASQLLGTSSLPYTSVAGKCMNFLLQQQQQNDNQRAAAAALLLGEDLQKFGRNRIERSDFSSSGGGMINPGSRQIYLTFPADSTFREEDVSNYFSIYGPVQDVRIPYQQKRMFGFVTFVYPETVKLILAKGNPHFVCDARVLVKPYKEKGKVPDKKQQNQDERGEYSSCTTPTGLDSRDPYDLQQLGGARMLYSNQDLLLRRKLEEQAELQQAIDMQSRRLMGLQLLDIKKHHHHRNLSMGAVPIPSPTHSHAFLNQTLINSMSSPRSSESREENCGSPAAATSPGADQLGGDQHSQQLAVNMDAKNEELIFVDNVTEEKPNGESKVHDGSSEHNLPDSPFASGGDASSFFSTDPSEAERSIAASSAFSSSLSSSPSSIHSNILAPSLFPPTSTLDMASFKSCFFPMPRFSSGQGAIEM